MPCWGMSQAERPFRRPPHGAFIIFQNRDTEHWPLFRIRDRDVPSDGRGTSPNAWGIPISDAKKWPMLRVTVLKNDECSRRRSSKWPFRLRHPSVRVSNHDALLSQVRWAWRGGEPFGEPKSGSKSRFRNLKLTQFDRLSESDFSGVRGEEGKWLKVEGCLERNARLEP